MTHSIATMVETLRRDPGSFGLTTGVGMHMQKHAYGVWSTNPDGASVPPSGTLPTDGATTPVTDVANGPATVATYAVLHGRDGGPESALLVCDLPDGSRCYAKLDEANDAFALAESQELIGQPVSLASADGINLARLN
jgi:acetyl-CoA C-acetyltransferase